MSSTGRVALCDGEDGALAPKNPTGTPRRDAPAADAVRLHHSTRERRSIACARHARQACLVWLALVGPSACSTRYVYTVPVGDLVRHPVADTAVTLRTSEGAAVHTTVERVTFEDGRYADLRRRGPGERITQAARASTGTAYLTVAQRSFAARNGAVVGATVVGILGALVMGLFAGTRCIDGCDSIPVQVTLGALLGAGGGAAVGGGLGWLFGAVIDTQRTAAQPATLIDDGR